MMDTRYLILDARYRILDTGWLMGKCIAQGWKLKARGLFKYHLRCFINVHRHFVYKIKLVA